MRFEKALLSIRALTRQPPREFEPAMRKLLHDAGVQFVLVPAIPRAHVSGVARWLSPTRPLIQLSLYGKTNDRFWFSFFHEAAHILLHANGKEDKKSIFLDDPFAEHSSDKFEREAKAWAGEYLIPANHRLALSCLGSKTAVKNFAQTVGVHPGIVVGRMQYEELIPVSWMNDLKVRFAFDGLVA